MLNIFIFYIFFTNEIFYFYFSPAVKSFGIHITCSGGVGSITIRNNTVKSQTTKDVCRGKGGGVCRGKGVGGGVKGKRKQ